MCSITAWDTKCQEDWEALPFSHGDPGKEQNVKNKKKEEDTRMEQVMGSGEERGSRVNARI